MYYITYIYIYIIYIYIIIYICNIYVIHINICIHNNKGVRISCVSHCITLGGSVPLYHDKALALPTDLLRPGMHSLLSTHPVRDF